MATPAEQIQTTGADNLREILRTTPRESHTHLPVADILHRLGIGPVERALLWLSKTDYYVLPLCTFHTRMTLSSLGMMVIFTTLLAFSSALYALATTMVDPDSSLRWPIAIFLAGVYAFGILIIDREIVGAVSKKSLLIRLFFAIFIAMAVSYPVKLKFFEGRLNVEINRVVDEKNADKLARIDALVQQGEPERLQQRESILAEIASLDKEIATLDRDITREQQNVECGRKCKELMVLKEKVFRERTARSEALQALSKPGPMTQEVQIEVERLRTEVSEEHRISYDFLTKWEALERIKKASGSDYWMLSGFIMVFFMLLELVPMALKWSLGKTEYHYYIESRTNLTNQKIIAITNAFLSAMQENPQNALNLPAEITDIIAAHMEDESSEPPRQVDLRGLLATLQQSGPPARDVPANNPFPFQPSQPANPVDPGPRVVAPEDQTLDEQSPPR